MNIMSDNNYGSLLQETEISSFYDSLFNQDDDGYSFYREETEEHCDFEGGNRSNHLVPKSNKPGQDNCCTATFKKSFSTFFPATPKTCYTYQGKWMRRVLGFAVLNHWVFFVFCLYFVGFKSTMFNLGLAFMSYSVYLTLR